MTRRPRTRLEDFDAVRDRMYIEAAEKAEALAVVEKIAIANAMAAHPVSKYVKEVPWERSEMYPAISESYQSLAKRIIGRNPSADGRRNANRVQENVPNIVWTLPGHTDPEASTRCGVFRTPSGRIPMRVCSNDPKDFMKAVGNHCGRLRCKNCMNLTALQTGVKIEDRICTPADLSGRRTGEYDRPKHWVVSPPQEWIKMICQNSRTFSNLVDDLVQLLPEYGMYSGVIIFHPWRLTEDCKLWLFSPHFHVVGFGYFRNEALRKKLDSLPEFSDQPWIFNQIHAEEEMRSVRHTLAYILTHAGIGTYDYDRDIYEIVDDLVIPVESGNGTVRKAKIIPKDVYDNLGPEGTGYYGELPPSFDWLDYIKGALTATLPVYRYFGSVNKLRVVGQSSEYVERVCPECGAPIVLYQDFSRHECEKVKYLRRSKIRCMKDDYDLISNYFNDHREKFKDDGYTLLNFAMSVPQCSTPETKGLQEYQSSKTVDQRKADRDRLIIYLPSVYDQGLDPFVVSRKEYLRIKKEYNIVDSSF